MERARPLLRLTAILAALLACLPVAAALAAPRTSLATGWLVGLEYLWPTEESRDIRTVNLDAAWWVEFPVRLPISFSLGVTGTYATGSIVRLEGRLEEGTLREVEHDNSAVGIGPVAGARLRLLDVGRASLVVSGSGAFVGYSERFPAGGDLYNFMWRGGPALDFRVGASSNLGLGYQWAHFSNGQGAGAGNPSYDAVGLSLMFRRSF